MTIHGNVHIENTSPSGMTDMPAVAMQKVDNAAIITSTISTPLGLIPVPDRYQQTLETIDSLRRCIPGVVTVLIDNSIMPLPPQWQHQLQSTSDVFLNVGQRTFCRDVNRLGIKGIGECYMLLVALDLISKHFDVQQRIFKISGRYRLGKNFDFEQHRVGQGKYCFKTRGVDHNDQTFLHTRLWSCCASLQTCMIDFVRRSLQTQVHQDVLVEIAMYACMDLSLLIEYDRIYCEGFIAPSNVWITD